MEKHKDKEDLRVIACGGDGTVGWVLSVIDEMSFENPPSVAVLPLGTGNDLARTFGWGGGYNKNDSIEAFLKRVINGDIVKLDRWTITTKPSQGQEGFENSDIHVTDKLGRLLQSSKSIEVKNKLPLNILNNYFSIGADAKVALDFHLSRGCGNHRSFIKFIEFNI